MIRVYHGDALIELTDEMEAQCRRARRFAATMREASHFLAIISDAMLMQLFITRR